MSARRPVNVLLALTMLFVVGCTEPPSKSVTRAPSEPPPKHDPATFRTDINRLIDAKRYDVAVAYLESADAKRQAEFDKTGYLAVGEFSIVLPGREPTARFDRNRDWFIPGTQDAIEDWDWQKAATTFAEEYNRHRDTSLAPQK